MTIVDTLNEIWNRILEITSMFVIPDWSALIGLLPLLIFLGVVGPLLTFTMLGILVYQVASRAPRCAFEEGPQVAAIGADGEPIFPPGLPVLPPRRPHLSRPARSAATRGEDELAVICPMCGLGRPAEIDTCTNCGLVLKVKPRPVPVAAARGPKPGGAAVA